VGKYTPRYSQVDASFRKTEYQPICENEGYKRKKGIKMKTMSICPHTIRCIEDWAGKKVSPRVQSVMQKKSVPEIVKEEDEEGVPITKKRPNATPAADENQHEEKTPVRAITTNHPKNRIARATLPNKNLIFVRTLKDEVPLFQEKIDPHSPLAIVNTSIIPRDFKPQKKSARKHVSHSLGHHCLGYNSIYQTEKYHIVQNKGLESHELRIEPNNCNIKPFKAKIEKTVAFNQYS
jgi:hypothetical protein